MNVEKKRTLRNRSLIGLALAAPLLIFAAIRLLSGNKR